MLRSFSIWTRDIFTLMLTLTFLFVIFRIIKNLNYNIFRCSEKYKILIVSENVKKIRIAWYFTTLLTQCPLRIQSRKVASMLLACVTNSPKWLWPKSFCSVFHWNNDPERPCTFVVNNLYQYEPFVPRTSSGRNTQYHFFHVVADIRRAELDATRLACRAPNKVHVP